MFWTLAKTDYKFEVYKIINESSFVSELGKYARDDTFKERVSEFFWNVISNSEQYKDELINNCITRFCEMVRYWDLRKKFSFFVQLTDNLAKN